MPRPDRARHPGRAGPARTRGGARRGTAGGGTGPPGPKTGLQNWSQAVFGRFLRNEGRTRKSGPKALCSAFLHEACARRRGRAPGRKGPDKDRRFRGSGRGGWAPGLAAGTNRKLKHSRNFWPERPAASAIASGRKWAPKSGPRNRFAFIFVASRPSENPRPAHRNHPKPRRNAGQRSERNARNPTARAAGSGREHGDAATGGGRCRAISCATQRPPGSVSTRRGTDSKPMEAAPKPNRILVMNLNKMAGPFTPVNDCEFAGSRLSCRSASRGSQSTETHLLLRHATQLEEAISLNCE